MFPRFQISSASTVYVHTGRLWQPLYIHQTMLFMCTFKIYRSLIKTVWSCDNVEREAIPRGTQKWQKEKRGIKKIVRGLLFQVVDVAQF